MKYILLMFATLTATPILLKKLFKVPGIKNGLIGKWYRWRSLARAVAYYNYYELEHFPEYQNQFWIKNVLTSLKDLDGYISEDTDYYIHDIKTLNKKDISKSYVKLTPKNLEAMIPVLYRGVRFKGVFLTRCEVIAILLL